MTPPGRYGSQPASGTGGQLRRSDQVPVKRSGETSTSNCYGDKSRGKLASREKTAQLKRQVQYRQRHHCGTSEDM